ncbi:MAG: DUF885 domain-containing protein [Acidimicrobiia bacterium]|nr:DUF885 domain-containing protein [Acidimicrobiia bacterium]
MNPDLRALADEYWDYTLEKHPTSAHMLGDYRFMDRMEDASRAAEDADIAKQRDFAARARAFDSETLSPTDLVTKETLLYEVETTAGVEEMRQAEFGVDPIFGPQASFQVSIPQMTVETPEHAGKMLDKYSAIAVMLDQMSDRLREGIASGRVNADFAVSRTVEQLDEILATDISDDVFLKAQMPGAYTEADIEAWKDRAAEIVRNEIRPAYARYRDVIRDEVGPVARSDEEAGLRYLPDGDLVYSRLIERYTTIPMQAEEIHEIGLQQIDRLAAEYLELAGPLLDTTSLEDIFTAMRDDPGLHHTTGEGVVAQSEEAFASAKAEMPNWFGRLPKSDCLVEETQHGPVAFYFPPAEDGSREGTFFMNTADPSSWGTYEVQSTAFHEGIPGHHLQIAIAQELGDSIPAFQRNGFISAYGEGWALYTERLADEMGLYSTDLDRVGMLSADSMRACRLVVDTGMHALGWSRQQAIDYVAANSPMAMYTIVEEIDRYLSFPGQALSYMIGRLEIQRMRADAEVRLGDRFDIKGFHDVVLGSGLVTLPTLDRMVGEWVRSS